MFQMYQDGPYCQILPIKSQTDKDEPATATDEGPEW